LYSTSAPRHTSTSNDDRNSDKVADMIQQSPPAKNAPTKWGLY
jgi:hypothetical protein